MATYLDRILAAHRAAAADDPRPLDALLQRAEAAPTAVRGFQAAIEADRGGRIAVVAEIKRRSPSLGSLAPILR